MLYLLPDCNYRARTGDKLIEVDYLNGHIVRIGMKYNVDVPVNAAVTSMIYEIELKKRSIVVDNINDHLFAGFN
jgi:hypothetical protein